MQLPDVVKAKMTALDHPVKAAMLKGSTSATLSSHSFLAAALQLTGAPETGAQSTAKEAMMKRAKRSKSGSDLRGLNILGLGLGLGQKTKNNETEDWCMVDESSPAGERLVKGRTRSHTKSHSVAPSPALSSASGASRASSQGSRSGQLDEKEGSAWWAMRLKSRTYRDLDAAELKRLRVALRTQAPSWTAEFVVYGGFAAMMKRLKELLEVEWRCVHLLSRGTQEAEQVHRREEQHDDQVLHEVLRCFRALLLSDVSQFRAQEALRI